jgi:predicted DNA-binding transcriptional regulator AlpA
MDEQSVIVCTPSQLSTIVRDAVAEAMSAIGSKAPHEEKLLAEGDVVKEFGVSKATLWRWKKAGYLKPSKLGRANYYRRADINAAMDRKEV